MQMQPADAHSDDDIQDVSLIDTPDINVETPATEGEQDKTPEQAPATEETKAEDAETDAKDTEATATPDEEGQAPTEQSEAEKKPDPDAARARYQNAARTRQAVGQQLDEKYGPKSAEQLVEEGMDPRDAEIRALREEMQYSQQRTAIAELNAGLQADAVNVVNDFKVFDPSSPEYDETFTKQVESLYHTAARLDVDPDNGIVLNAEVPLYDFYKQAHDMRQSGIAKGTQQKAQDTLQMLSRTEDSVGGSTKTPDSDSLEALEERLGNVRIA